MFSTLFTFRYKIITGTAQNLRAKLQFLNFNGWAVCNTQSIGICMLVNILKKNSNTFIFVCTYGTISSQNLHLIFLYNSTVLVFGIHLCCTWCTIYFQFTYKKLVFSNLYPSIRTYLYHSLRCLTSALIRSPNVYMS